MANGFDGVLSAPRQETRSDIVGGVLSGVSRRLKAAAQFAYLLLTGPF